jgi:hypothetical protein
MHAEFLAEDKRLAAEVVRVKPVGTAAPEVHQGPHKSLHTAPAAPGLSAVSLSVPKPRVE